MKTADTMITDAELNEAWGNADFGGASKRDVIIDTLKKFVQGWATGSTAKCIVSELGLIWSRNGHDGLSDKGLQYLLAASHPSPMSAEQVEELIAMIDKVKLDANFSVHYHWGADMVKEIIKKKIKLLSTTPSVKADGWVSVEDVIKWMNTWEQLKDTVIPIRFKEDFAPPKQQL